MALLKRKTDEEKAAEAAAAERLAAFVSALPKWEYMVLAGTELAGALSGKPSPKKLEQKLNALAAEGWKVVTMSFTGQIREVLAFDTNHMFILLEQPARPIER
jgi:Domain of unknown function (DUF4177)